MDNYVKTQDVWCVASGVPMRTVPIVGMRMGALTWFPSCASLLRCVDSSSSREVSFLSNAWVWPASATAFVRLVIDLRTEASWARFDARSSST